MDPKLYQLHLKAGEACGKAATCGIKKAYSTEEIATRAAASHNKWEKRRHNVEPYPCTFCGMWHVGKLMTLEALMTFAED